MKKIDRTVLKETGIIALGTIILSIIMNAVLFAVSRFTDALTYDYTIVTGSLLGAFAAVFNFFLMGLAVQKTVESGNTESAKKRFQLSYMLRTALLVGILALGVILKYFHWLPVLLSVFFPRIVILFRSFKLKSDSDADGGSAGKEV